MSDCSCSWPVHNRVQYTSSLWVNWKGSSDWKNPDHNPITERHKHIASSSVDPHWNEVAMWFQKQTNTFSIALSYTFRSNTHTLAKMPAALKHSTAAALGIVCVYHLAVGFTLYRFPLPLLHTCNVILLLVLSTRRPALCPRLHNMLISSVLICVLCGQRRVVPAHWSRVILHTHSSKDNTPWPLIKAYFNYTAGSIDIKHHTHTHTHTQIIKTPCHSR